MMIRERKMDIEKLWYEFSPYLYAIAGVISIFNPGTYLSIILGVLLIAFAVAALGMRWVYRKKLTKEID
jgi:uncharacterized membrane protein HdeD (DUF308 family)